MFTIVDYINATCHFRDLLHSHKKSRLRLVVMIGNSQIRPLSNQHRTMWFIVQMLPIGSEMNNQDGYTHRPHLTIAIL